MTTGKPRHRHASKPLGHFWDSIEVAAAKLDTEPQALRARCRRASRDENGEVVARLGLGGVVAKKFGTSWRLYVPSADASTLPK